MTDFNLVLSQVRQRLEILYQIVDELEAQGGGGGTGTNYNELENKPKINGVTLSGNKTSSDLDLVTTSDITDRVNTAIAALDVNEVGGSTYFLTTIKEVDGKIEADAVAQSTILSDYLTTSDAASTYQTQAGMSSYLTSSDAASTYQTQAGMSNYYNKTETGTQITNAINALDATSVGGAGKYITTVSEANGIISAEPATIQTSVNTSDNAVSSSAVKTYVDTQVATKASISDVFGLGVSLANYNSLDNLTPGNYYAENGTVATAVGAPYTRSGFNLWVMATNNTTRRVQLLFPNPNGNDYYTKGFILFRQEVGGTWEAWHTLTDAHGLGNSVVVGAEGINLDTLKTEGVWYSASTTGAQNSVGRPDYDSSGARVWRLDVYKMYSTRAWQELTVYRLGTSEGEFDKYFRINKTDGTWTDWQHVDTTTINTYYPPAPNNLNSLQLTRPDAELTVEPDEDEPQDER